MPQKLQLTCLARPSTLRHGARRGAARRLPALAKDTQVLEEAARDDSVLERRTPVTPSCAV